MKYSKRILSLLMSVCMLLSLLPLSAYAESASAGGEAATPALTLDVPVSVEIEEEVQYSFTPAESGCYAFWVHSPNGCSSGWMSNEESSRWYDGYSVSYGFMNAGETYYCYATSWEYSGALTELGISKAAEVSELRLEETEITIYVGSYESLDIEWEPMLGYSGEVTWSISDKRVLEIDGCSTSSCDIWALSAGTATVTATLDNGLTASCVVTVKNYPALVLDVPVTEPVDGEATVKYCFTPEESGYYAFWVYCPNGEGDGWFDGYESARVYGDYSIFYGYMCAGETYQCYAMNWADSQAMIELGITKAVDITDIWLNKADATVYEGGSVWLDLNIDPMFGYPCDVSWEISDEDILDFYWYGDTFCGISAQSVGTATVTATLNNGMTASCEVTVKPAPALYLDTPFCEIVEDNINYQFTPEESGYYAFYVYDPEHSANCMLGEEEFARWYDDYCISYNYLTAGETYSCYVYNEADTSRKLECCISKTVEVTAIELETTEKPVLLLGYDACKWIDLNFEPMLSYVSSDDITWSSSDESVVEVYYDGEAWFNAPGTATVTATLPNGVSDSIAVTGKEPITLPVEVSTEFELSPTGDYFIFRPKTNGYYKFSIEAENSAFIEIYNADLGFYNSGYVTSEFRTQEELRAGVPYYMYVCSGNGETGSATIFASEVPCVTGMNIVQLPEKTSYVQGYLDNSLDLTGLILELTWSDGTVSLNYDAMCDDTLTICYYAQENGDQTGTVTIECFDVKVTFDVELIETVPGEITADEINDAIQSSGGDVHLSVEQTELTISAEAVKLMRESDSVDRLTVELKDGLCVELDKPLIDVLLEQSMGEEEISIQAEEIDAADLNEEQCAALDGKDVACTLSAVLLCGDEIVSDFQGGTVAIKLPFCIAEGDQAEQYRLYHISDAGEMTEVEIVYDEAGYMVFTLEHFSEYVIIREKNHLPGDINGDGRVNNKDATRLFQYLSNWDVEVVEAALDVNGDGKVNNKDATRLFQYLSNWAVEIF